MQENGGDEADPSYLNPFELRHPWYMNKDARGRVYYYNAKTKHAQWERPPEIWELVVDDLARVHVPMTARFHCVLPAREFIANLLYGQVTPRCGRWIWKESDDERARREAKTLVVQERERIERERRALEPTLAEEVADTIAALVQQVYDRVQSERARQKLEVCTP